MKRQVVCVLFFLFISGCSQNQDQSFSEVTMKQAQTVTENFISQMVVENGVYMYLGEKNNYLFLNGVAPDENNKNTIFSSVVSETKGNKLNIYYETENVTKAEDNEEAGFQRLYRLPPNDSYSTIQIIENGREVPIDTIYAS
ncbi:hypothetical protein [Salibacterium qingdaonense]|uniref:Uncharacterized protein n=1 Tax=Salibacterium qingdaonense TaxID=266892 RepID=A0A1I4PVN1_9BACI|nr:hypothetical protein [Salibacterium qingdaonense]SFM31804.1 hypothetical protein SAMN04488054_13227 [Salibacterium qingdaonense]